MTHLCPTCDKPHAVDAKTVAMFGPDVDCIPCVDRAHLTFMKKHGKRMRLSCVLGCPCGFGKR